MCKIFQVKILTKTNEKGGEKQLFYHLLTINIILINTAGKIKKLNGPHMTPGLMPDLSLKCFLA